MDLLSIIGIIAALLFFIKLGIHVFIKRSLDKKFPLGAFGQYTNPIFFFPIAGDVPKNFKLAKRVGNIFYSVSLLLFVVFLIGIFLNERQ